MKEYVVTMDRDNRIKIPDDVLREHGLADGDKIEIVFL